MGLDMYLTKHVYVGAEYEHRKVTGVIDISVYGEKLPVNFDKVSKIIESFGYWRKSNQIHKWFVDNVQDGEDDCGEYYVSPEKIKELLDLVNRVLENHDLADQLLPSQGGFFFGSTNYDDDYFYDLERTKMILEEATRFPDDSFYYHSSW